MFFSWYAKNRHFKKGGKLSGQIAPFLLVSLVILLVAATATIRIGKVAVDKTCTDNMADAGSLAAASVWDAFFNVMLAPQNCWAYLNYKFTYLPFVEWTVYDIGNSLDAAAQHMMDATAYTAAAEAGLLAGQLAVLPAAGGCSIIWVHFLVVGAVYILANLEIGKAETDLGTAWGLSDSLRSVTNDYKEALWDWYCQLRTAMNEAPVVATESGVDLALANGCSASKQASFAPMPTFTYYELTHTKKNYPDPLNVNVGEVLADMFDQAVALLPPALRNLFGVPAAARALLGSLFPDNLIEDDYFGLDTLEHLMLYCDVLSAILWVNSGVSVGIYFETMWMLTFEATCLACVVGVGCPACGIWAFMCGFAWGLAIGVFADTLAVITGELAITYTILTILKPQIGSYDPPCEVLDAWSELPAGDPQSLFKSFNCEDVKTAPPVTGKNTAEYLVDGLIFVDIYDVILSGWTVTCNASQENESSWSTSQFDGGNVGEGGYWPRIIATD